MDSLWGDCDKQQYTGGYVGFLQGDIIHCDSFIADLFPLSSGEVEANVLSVGCTAVEPSRSTVANDIKGGPSTDIAVPVLAGSSAAEAITRNSNKQGTHCTQSIACHWMCCCYEYPSGEIAIRGIPSHSEEG